MLINNYEVPEQFEMRTGELLPDNTAVFYKLEENDSHWCISYWGSINPKRSLGTIRTAVVVIASPPFPPN